MPRKQASKKNSLIPASLIFTVLNEESSIISFVDSITLQDPMPLEVICVDGGSSDRTVDKLQAWQPPVGVNFVLRVLDGANISEGRNAAISIASHDFILCSDAGTTLEPGWIAGLWGAHLNKGAEVVSGFFHFKSGSFFQNTLGAVTTPTLSEVNPDLFLPSSRSVGFTKEAWGFAGGYPEWLDYCEDLVFDLALKEAGVTFTFEGGSIASWEPRRNLVSFFKQYFRYARGDGKAGLWWKRHVFRYAFFIGIALALSIRPPGWEWLLSAGLLAYWSKTVVRVYKNKKRIGAKNLTIAIPLGMFLTLTGDVAKAIGYPAGLFWRIRRGWDLARSNR